MALVDGLGVGGWPGRWLSLAAINSTNFKSSQSSQSRLPYGACGHRAVMVKGVIIMANINNLIIFHEARQLVRDIVPITESVRFGDLGNQMRRAAISVVSNICEGSGHG